MTTCENCGQPNLSEGTQFCSACGHPVAATNISSKVGDSPARNQPFKAFQGNAPVAFSNRKGVKAIGAILAVLAVTGSGYLVANQLDLGGSVDAGTSLPSLVAPSVPEATKSDFRRPAISEGATTPTFTATPTASEASPSASMTDSAASARTQEMTNTSDGWKTVTYGRLVFDLPPGYSAHEPAPMEPAPTSSTQMQTMRVQIQNKQGKNIAYAIISTSPLSQKLSLPTERPCATRVAYDLLEHQVAPGIPAASDAKELSTELFGKITPRFVYRVTHPELNADASTDSRDTRTKYRVFLGLTDRTAGMDSTTCNLYPYPNPGTSLNITEGDQNIGIRFAGTMEEMMDGPGPRPELPAPAMYFDSLGEAEAYMQTDEYKTLKRMFASAQFK